MNTKVLLLVLISIFTCSMLAFADPRPEIVPQVIEPYNDFVIADETNSHEWIEKPENGWTVKDRRSNRIGYQTYGRVQWLDKETHHILRRSFLPVWRDQDAYADMVVKAVTSRDGSLVASQSNDVFSNKTGDEIYWADTRTGAIRKQFRDLTYPFVFSPNGKYFVATIYNPKTYKYTLSVHSVPDGNTIKTMDLANYPLFLLWSNDTKMLASLDCEWSSNSTINLTMWGTDNFQKLGQAQWHGNLKTVFFDDQNDLQVLSEPVKAVLSTMELRSWKPTGEFYTFRTITFGTQGDTIIGFPKNGSILMRGDFSEGSDYHFRYYLLDKINPPRQLTPEELKNPEFADIIKWFQDNPRIPLDENDFARLYEIKTLRVTNGKVLAADASHVFNVLDGHLYNAFKPIPLAATAYDISPNGKFFTSAGADELATFHMAFWGMWNLKNAKSLWDEQFTGKSPGIDANRYALHGQTWTAQLAFSPNNKRVALSGSLNHPSLAVYNAHNGHGIWAHPSDVSHSFVRHFDWSGNGRELAVAMDNTGRWKIINAKTGNIQHQFEVHGKVLFIAWCSDDNVLLARQTPDKYDKPRYDHPPREICYLELRDAKTGNLISANSQTFAEIKTMAVSPNQKYVAVSYNDGTLRVWEIATGKLLFNKTSQTVDIAWRGNHQIVTAEANDGVNFWSIPQQKLLATALFMYPWKKDREKQKTAEDEAQWLIYTPDNYYDCSPGAEKYIRWRVGEKLLPPDSYKSTFHDRRKVMGALSAGL